MRRLRPSDRDAGRADGVPGARTSVEDGTAGGSVPPVWVVPPHIRRGTPRINRFSDNPGQSFSELVGKWERSQPPLPGRRTRGGTRLIPVRSTLPVPVVTGPPTREPPKIP